MFTRLSTRAAFLVATFGLIVGLPVSATNSVDVEQTSIAFMSGSLTINKNNDYVITWKVDNPREITVNGYYKLHYASGPESFWRTCYRDWSNPATKVTYLNVGTGPKATGLIFQFRDNDNRVLIAKTPFIPRR